MQSIVLAANGADAAAVDAITQQHTELGSTLAVKTIHVIDAVTAGNAPAIGAARGDLAGWCRSALLPHLRREAEVLFPAAPHTAESAAVVADLERSLRELEAGVDLLQDTEATGALSDAAGSLRGLLDRHLAAENSSLLPYLAFSREATLADLWRRVRDTSASGDVDAAAAEHRAGAECHCADEDAELPTLDVRAVPHAIRHATVFGALGAIGVGGGMILVAPHDPLPLLAQIEQRMPGRFTVSYLLREPAECRLQFLRQRS